MSGKGYRDHACDQVFLVERVTRIDRARSAWEAVPSWLLHGLSCKEACP